jgi:hypothetical protein
MFCVITLHVADVRLFQIARDVVPNLLEKLNVLLKPQSATTANAERYIPACNDPISPEVILGPDSLKRLSDKKAWLDQDGVSGVAYLLLRYLNEQDEKDPGHFCDSVSIFHTQAYYAAQNGTDHALFYTVHTSMFWERPCWIIPIHKPDKQHWILGVISHSDQKIWIFDSYGSYSEGALKQEAMVR